MLAGARCQVIESGTGDATVTFAETGGTADSDPTDGIVLANGSTTVTVTNAFPGVLPATGSSTLELVLQVAGLLILGGTALVLLLRRRWTSAT